MDMDEKTHIRGFTIIELSVVLTVIALIAGSALAVGASRIEAQKIKATQERIDFIMETIELYVRQFCALPCPADGNLAPDNANFGLATNNGSEAAGHCTSENYTVTAASAVGNILAGIVPVRTLGLSHALALDGWNRRFTYVVDEDLAWANGTASGYGSGTLGEITVEVADTSTDITTTAALIVMSHGTNGHGAWKGKGNGRLDKNITGADELANSWNGNGVAGESAFDATFVQQFRNQNFDDMLEYRMKWQMPTPVTCP